MGVISVACCQNLQLHVQSSSYFLSVDFQSGYSNSFVRSLKSLQFMSSDILGNAEFSLVMRVCVGKVGRLTVS